jgi:hypothetical protein
MGVEGAQVPLGGTVWERAVGLQPFQVQAKRVLTWRIDAKWRWLLWRALSMVTCLERRCMACGTPRLHHRTGFFVRISCQATDRACISRLRTLIQVNQSA